MELSQPLIAGCKTPAEAAIKLNQKLFALTKVRYSTERRRADQSPSESMETGKASCTGLSILLVDACRSVGIPARVVGIPNWVDKRGNHTWVEIWDGRWHFTGAAEQDPNGLDRGWFAGDAARAIKTSREHSIYAVSYRKTDTPFPMVWAYGRDTVSGVNVTDRYTPKTFTTNPDKTRLFISVLDKPGGKRQMRLVQVKVLEEAKWQWKGVTRDETKDLNDFLTFEVPKNKTFLVALVDGKEQVEREFRPSEGAGLCTIYLKEENTRPAAFCAPPLDPKLPPLTEKQMQQLRQEFARFFALEEPFRGNFKFSRSLEKLLVQNEPAVRSLAWESFLKSSTHLELRKDFDARKVRFGDELRSFTITPTGNPPVDGWPLVIRFMDETEAKKTPQAPPPSQTPSSGESFITVVLHCPTGKLSQDQASGPLISSIVKQMVLFQSVNPNKVFVHNAGQNLPDRWAVADRPTASLIRNPTPFEVSWKPNSARADFFWLSFQEKLPSQTVTAQCRNNIITVQSEDAVHGLVYLDNRMITFDEPIYLEKNGRRVVQKIKPSLTVLGETMLQRADPELAFTAVVAF